MTDAQGVTILLGPGVTPRPTTDGGHPGKILVLPGPSAVSGDDLSHPGHPGRVGLTPGAPARQRCTGKP
ncbi:hypothetical protein L860_000835 [Cutibacterium granulosum DSM 20700]|uniref:Uncharacterized protein n=1 Tax=Cutibacterium granulosum DSM 20700 TaxID=1160719 RepID=A0A9X5R1B7_9ACTN|nr:hypothetical protein [Cutibacterium granulosum]KAG9059654.1 hypothetical protein L860_000835 [Cutibacterium granulosum DSM 20700]